MSERKEIRIVIGSIVVEGAVDGNMKIGTVHGNHRPDTVERADNVPSVSISGAPEIAFKFAGHICTAELAGTRMFAEMRSDGGIDMRITDATGEILADIIVNERAHRNATENLMDVGSALWSNWRYQEASRSATIDEEAKS
jgi:hypothetical protein